MKATAIFALVIGLAACSTPEERQRAAVMDQIEKQLQLPEGARPFGEYARHYAERDNGHVVGVYLVPFEDEIRSGESCEELDANFASHPVPREPMEMPKQLAAGEREWLKSPRDLPFISDGGCAQITVIFDKAKSAVLSAECNGRA